MPLCILLYCLQFFLYRITRITINCSTLSGCIYSLACLKHTHTHLHGLVIAVVDAAGALLNISLLTASDTLTLNRYYCCPSCSPDTTPELGGTRCESHCSRDYLSPPPTTTSIHSTVVYSVVVHHRFIERSPSDSHCCDNIY